MESGREVYGQLWPGPSQIGFLGKATQFLILDSVRAPNKVRQDFVLEIYDFLSLHRRGNVELRLLLRQFMSTVSV